MKDLEKYCNILWDFDGVILNSMDVRHFGFGEIFSAYPESNVKKLLEFHEKNGGLSRYVKIRYFFEEVLGKEISEDQVNVWASKYSEIMLANLQKPELIIEDSLNFIQETQHQYRHHIVSGSDNNELNFLCKALKIHQNFISIHGSPIKKPVHINNIIANNKYQRSETVMIGDSKNDFDAAVATEIDFRGYNNPSLKELHPKYIESFQ